MPATLRDLTSQTSFGLRPVHAVDAATLDRPLLWAHSSDLPDPTPWLGTDGLLLTDGVQFSGPDPVAARPYVERLVAHGVPALGFATGIAHEQIPAAVAEAAASAGLALFEVPRDTPFMAVIRFVADAVARDDREVLERSLRAQRSVARAALRPDGLAEILRELEHSLDCWVALFDAAGARMRVTTRRELPAAQADEVRVAVERMLDGGRVAAARLTLPTAADPSGEVTLQTLGTQGELRGVLAVGTGTGALDRARADLVEAVIGLASIALEQSRTLDDARRRLRSGILELLLAGMTDVARRTVIPLWGALPAEPVRVACITASAREEAEVTPSMRSALELLAGGGDESLFFAEHDGELVAITGDDGREGLRALVAQHGWRAGFSAAAGWADLSSALAEARTALARSHAGQPMNDFDDLAHAGLLGHLERTSAHDIARRMLSPLDAPTAPPDLRHTLETWLHHNGAWDPAAKALGMHRHTLRARVDAAGTLLGLDLSTFGARAELWSALQLTTHPAVR